MSEEQERILDELRAIEAAVGRIRARLTPTVEGMARFSQNDPRWAREIYAGGETFAKAGCLVVCVAMVASQVYPEVRPPEVARKLREVGAFEGALLSKPARIPRAFPLLRWDGYQHWRTIPANVSRLAVEVATRGPTIIELAWDVWDSRPPQAGNQHFAVAVGVPPAMDDVVMVDAFDGEEKSLVESRYAAPRRWGAARAVHGMRLLRVG